MDDLRTQNGNGHEGGNPLMRFLTSPFGAMRGWGLHGLSFLGRRNAYEVLGYDRNLTPQHYRARYRRGGIAARIVEAFPQATWRGGWNVIEDADPDTETTFEKAFKELDKRLGIKNIILRADILAGLGRYAVVLIGGPGPLDQPLERCTADQIKYLVPYSEDDAKIVEYEGDTQSERFALPRKYSLQRRWYQDQYGAAAPPVAPSTPVHYSRIVHVADGLLDDTLFGQPRLERVWNLLDDLDKVIGGGAEAFWKRADGGTHFNIDKEMSFDPDPKKAEKEKLDMQTKFEEFVHDQRRFLVTRGVDVSRLGSDTADLRGPAAAIMDQISATIGIPQRLLMGSELGKLASSKDKANWEDRVQDRRTSFGEYQVVRPFIDRLIGFGALPQPKEYTTEWPETEELDEAEKAAVAVQVSSINRNEGSTVVTPSEIRTIYLGLEALTPEQEAEIEKIKQEKIEKQQQIFAQKALPPKGPIPPQAQPQLQAAQHSYGSVQVDLPLELRRRILALGETIPREDLAADGRETNPHITVKYGILTTDGEEVRRALEGETPISFTLGVTSYFEGEGYDVVVVRVDSSCLYRVNSTISSQLDVVDTWPNYIPHATVAYVKKGLGEKYSYNTSLKGLEATVTSVTFISAEDEETTIELEGAKPRAALQLDLKALEAALIEDDLLTADKIVKRALRA